MKLDLFFDKVCTIFSITVTSIDRTDVPVKAVLGTLENIPCDFGKGVTARNNTEQEDARETDQELMEIVINGDLLSDNPDLLNIRKGMYIELYENPENTPILTGIYIINTVDWVKDMYGCLDNVYMSATQTEDVG